MEMVVGREGGVVFDDEVYVWEVEATGGDVCAEEDGRVGGAGEGLEG